MLTNICLGHLRTVGRCLQQQSRRNIGVTAVVWQQAEDPIQQLFVQKIREYAQKKTAAGGKLVDATPANMAALESELNRLKLQYKVEGADFSKFPEFKFQEFTCEASQAVETSEATDLPL